MPCKRRSKGRARGQARPGADADTARPPRNAAETEALRTTAADTVNAEIFAEVQSQITAIMQHSLMGDLVTANPLTTWDGGFLPPITGDDFDAFMSRGKGEGMSNTFTCGGVFMWANHLLSPTPGVSIIARAVDLIMAQSYPTAPTAALRHPLHIAITEDDIPDIMMNKRCHAADLPARVCLRRHQGLCPRP